MEAKNIIYISDNRCDMGLLSLKGRRLEGKKYFKVNEGPQFDEEYNWQGDMVA